MKTLLVPKLCAVLFAFNAIVLCSLLSSCDSKPSYATLAAWKRHTARQGFRLLDAAQTTDYFIAIYDTGRDEIAVCYYWRGSGFGPASHGFDIRDKHMKALDDMKRPSVTDLLGKQTVRTSLFSSATYSYVDGMVYPIRRGYRGGISIRMTASDGQGGRETDVYNKKLDL